MRRFDRSTAARVLARRSHQDGDFGQLMADSQKKKAPRRKLKAQARTAGPASTIERVRDLAWAAQHAQAVELATTALAQTGVSAARRLDLLDLRAETFIAQGDLDRAAEDAAAMLGVAQSAKTAKARALALNRQAQVQTLKGEFKAATRTATAALKAGRQSRQQALEALSLYRLGEAQFGGRSSRGEIRRPTQAVELFRALRMPVEPTRPLTRVSAAKARTGRVTEATQASSNVLAIIDRIQHGIAAALGFQAIVELVGDKLREVFATGDITIAWRSQDYPSPPLVHILYAYQHGARLNLPPVRVNPDGPMSRAFDEKRPLVANTRAQMKAYGLRDIEGKQPSLSTAMVPIFSGERTLGGISLQNLERENAFGEAEVRLLSTVAASLGVALENARLFDETQRLLKETEQRAAELAIINSVQAALAAKLDMQGIYDAVGDKIREIFGQADVEIRIHEPVSRLLHVPYFTTRGKRISIAPRKLDDTGFAAHVLRTG
jgi:hypothetical protein